MKYLLSIKIDIEAIDDPEARKKAVDIIFNNGLSLPFDSIIKLQQINEKSPPRGIEMEKQTEVKICEGRMPSVVIEKPIFPHNQSSIGPE